MIKPNASIVSFITIHDGDKEKILLALLRQVVDVPPETTYWYPKYGQDGESKYLLPMHHTVIWL